MTDEEEAKSSGRHRRGALPLVALALHTGLRWAEEFGLGVRGIPARQTSWRAEGRGDFWSGWALCEHGVDELAAAEDALIVGPALAAALQTRNVLPASGAAAEAAAAQIDARVGSQRGVQIVVLAPGRVLSS